MTVPALSIVKHFDVVKDICKRQIECFADSPFLGVWIFIGTLECLSGWRRDRAVSKFIGKAAILCTSGISLAAASFHPRE